MGNVKNKIRCIESHVMSEVISLISNDMAQT